jgi:serine/threonine protein kinase/GGDEF domain-containing protein
MIEKQRTYLPPLQRGSVINDRYEIRRSLGIGGMGEVFLADDRTSLHLVALKIVRPDTRMPGDDEALRLEMIIARRVASPNVCRVHDLVPSPYGPILVMEYIVGKTLHQDIRQRKGHGGYSCDEFRRIASDVCQGVAAIHATGLVHGDIKPGNVMVTSNPDGSLDRAVVLDFGFAKERGGLAGARGPDTPPDGGTANYMAPERILSGGASFEDDLYALGLTLWEMWTCSVPEPGDNPRTRPMRQQTKFDVLAGLSVDEIKQIFWCLSSDPEQRMAGRHLVFFNPGNPTVSSVQIRRERLDPGPPPGRNASKTFVGGSQSLLVTFAANAPELVGELIALDRPMLSIGRRNDVDIVVPESTVSGHHANLTWSNGSWRVEDVGSTNGTYVEHTYKTRKVVDLLHGGEVQLGELRLKLVSFGRGTLAHKRAHAFLLRRDGLTGLLTRDRLVKALDEECAFSEWIEQSLCLARYEIRGPNQLVSDRPTITEMLALRRAAARIVELTDELLLSLIAVTAGRTRPLRFAVIMVGPGPQEAQNLVEQVVGQMEGLLPEGLELVASIACYKAGMNVRSLIDQE